MLCKKPKLIYNRYLNRNVFVPCGKCQACLTQKTNSLIPRVINECESHPAANVFFTLTYDNAHLPIIDMLDCTKLHRCNGDVVDMVDDGLLKLDSNYSYALFNSPPNITRLYNHVIEINPDMVRYRAVLCRSDVQDFLKRVRIQLYRFLFRSFKLAFIKSLKNDGRFDLVNMRATFSCAYWNLLDSYSSYLLKKDTLFYSNLLNFKGDIIDEFRKRADRFSKLRYFVCGEYGSSWFRPHYHGIFHTKCPQIARILCKIIPSCWSFCDWKKVAKRRGKSGRSGMPSVVSSEAASYVSTYVNSHDYRFSLALHPTFKPFCLYSKRPVYGLSSFDKDIIKKVLTGVNYTFQQVKSVNRGKAIVVECSYLCERYLFPRLSGISNYSFQDVLQIVSRPFVYLEGGVKFFAQRVRRLVKSFYGYVNSSSIFDYLSKIWNFKNRLESYRVRKQMLEFCPSNAIDYVKRQYQTFADLFHYSNQNIIKNCEVIDNLSKYLFSFSPYIKLDSFLDSFVNKPLENIFCIFNAERKKYINKYNSYLFVKHSHSKNSSYYETV